MDSSTLEAKLLAFIAAQRRQGEEWLENPFYTHGRHNVGSDVSGAALLAARTVGEVPRQADAAAYHAALTAALERIHELYREEAEDPDGYGSATFHEIRNALAALNPATR